MRRTALVTALLATAALAACETPRESCINQGSRELRTVEALVAETQGNIDRGYGIVTEQRTEVVTDFCRIERDDGTTDLRPCDRTEVRDVQRPVTLDIDAERVKLDQLLARRDRLASQQADRIRACTAAYPE